ncbi:IgGFc-binding protein [Nannocystis sp. SCPEA4]|uniref:IgGFc-binding protein n=1 Tax=Nannocystis sp. SCPEA4 TaxID=2996787 RepID=UPI0022714976|nr:IgGFc-binding protein [Nannocystis sp. SCPEA4]MCY1055570.1 IgGFc-binding protein [Nannocystis sp. SCPEA4]
MTSSLRLIAAITIIAGCGGSTANTGASEGTSSTGESTSSTGDTTPTTTMTAECGPGEIQCVGETEVAVCGDDGQFGAPAACPAAGVCVDGVGCAGCTPGAVRCDGDALQQCSDANEWEVVQTCSAAQGLTCDDAAMACTGVCAPDSLPMTASGCEFYAVTTVNVYDPAGLFAVVIENPGDSDASVTITRNEDFTPLVETVPAGTAQAIELPFVGGLADAVVGKLVYDGAYHIESDRPVRVVQYNTFNVTASTDSSLLWPRHTWGSDYFVASYPSTELDTFFNRGFWAAVAGADETTLEATSLPGTKAKAGPGIGVDGSGKAPLGSGDVLEILSGDPGDITGTRLVGDRPIQVLGGHECSFVPMGVGYCDHLEDAMLPISQLGTEYVVAAPVMADPPTSRRAQVVRVIATEADTTLTYDPPLPGAPTTITGPGEFVELEPSPENFVLVSDKPVLVAQYMVGDQFDDSDTDPSMLATLPVARWHTSHYVHALPEWLPPDIDILAPTGATVTLDGMAVTDFEDVGNSPYRIAHVRLQDDPGLVAIESDQPIAVNVYATTNLNSSTSYWHSAGGSLAR